MQDFALNRVRPLFATLDGVSAPPPFGGNQRTIVVRLDPGKLREYRISTEEAINAVNKASAVLPSGNVRTEDLIRIANTNSVIGGNLRELADAPVRTGSGPTPSSLRASPFNDPMAMPRDLYRWRAGRSTSRSLTA